MRAMFYMDLARMYAPKTYAEDKNSPTVPKSAEKAGENMYNNPRMTNEEIFAFFQEHLTSDLKARSFRLSSSKIDVEHPFVQACIKEGLKPFGSPTLRDQALMRFPSVKMGPGDSARSHGADEYIRGMEIREAIDLYVRLLDGLSL